jgi:WD40 repeat protein
MNTRLFSLSAGFLFVFTAITICEGAPAPKPSPPKERFTLRSGGSSWIAFSPDGKILAAACFDKTIRFWDVAKGEEIAKLSGHTRAVTCLAFSPDGKFLVSNAADNSLRLWDVTTRKPLAVLDEHWGETKNLLFTRDSKSFVCGGQYTDFWDIKNKLRNERVNLPIDSSQYLFPEPSLGYNADGKLLTVFWPREPRTMEVWDIRAGKCLRRLEYPEGDFRMTIAVSPDYKMIASGWHGICIWDVASGKRIGVYRRPKDIGSLAFGPEGKILAAAWRRDTGRPAPPSWEGVISLLDATTGKELALLESQPGDVGPVAFSPDGKTLASVCIDRTIKLWDIHGVKAPKKKD